MRKNKKKVNASILIIGNEILSGRTQDLNVSFLYAIIQLAVSLLVIWNVKFQKMNEWYLLVGVIFILVLLYVLIKHKVMSKSRS